METARRSAFNVPSTMPPSNPFPAARRGRLIHHLIKIEVSHEARTDNDQRVSTPSLGRKRNTACSQAIRNYIRNGIVPGEQIGKLWYVDWAAFNASNGNDLVAMVLKGAA